MAQVVAHHIGSVEVTGSNPVSSSIEKKGLNILFKPFFDPLFI
jgi:hypothetical protein